MMKRCPYQAVAEKEGSVVYVNLDGNPEERDRLIKKGLEEFYGDEDKVSIYFILPESFKKRFTAIDEDLHMALFEYQSEIISNEIYCRLFPFMPKQNQESTDEKHMKQLAPEFWRRGLASTIIDSLGKIGISIGSKHELKLFIKNEFIHGSEDGIRNISFTMKRGGIECIRITTGGAVMEVMGDNLDRNNCFGIVMTPYYPKDYARYSDDIKIVLTKHIVFSTIESKKVEVIKKGIYSVYRKTSTEESLKTLSDGLWIPEYRQVNT